MKTDETLFAESDFQELRTRHGAALTSFLARKYLGGNEEQAATVAEWAIVRLQSGYDRRYKLRPTLFTLAANRAIEVARAA